jgi:hypothetical protein
LRVPDEAVQKWAALSMAEVTDLACEWVRSLRPRLFSIDAGTSALAATVWLARRARCTRQPLYALLGPETRVALGDRLSQVA